nr:hypothetical protein [Tanacetum cinerariifolium]
MYRLVKKLKKLKRPLNKLNWNQGNVYEKVRKLKEILKKDQEVVDKNPSDINAKVKAAQTLNELIKASSDEINLLYQKEKIKWIKDGDKNTTFFHSIKVKRNKNRDESIRDENVLVDDAYFKRKINNEEARHMINEVTDKEIKEAIFDIDSNKAVGLDVYSSEFFKKACDIVGKDVCLAVKEFFKKGKLLGE